MVGSRFVLDYGRCYVVIAVALGYTHFAIFSTALTGACLGFLFYNQHPAKMFMGDTGSLALGGA